MNQRGWYAHILFICLILAPSFGVCDDAFLEETARPPQVGTTLGNETPSSTEVPQSRNALRAKLPGHDALLSLEPESDTTEIQRVKIIAPTGQVRRTIPIAVEHLTDFGSVTAVLARSAQSVAGSVRDRSRGGEKHYMLAAAAENPSGEKHYTLEASTGADALRTLRCSVDAEHSLARLTLSDSLSGESANNSSEGYSATIQRLSSSVREIQIIVVSPGEYSGTLSEDQIATKVLAAIATANNYLSVLGLQLHLVGVQIFRNGADPYAAAVSSRDATRMLTAVQELWASRKTPEHDLVAIFGLGAYGNTYGLAYSAVSCTVPEYSFLFVTQGGTSSAAELSLGATLAHEVGHFLGMEHDPVRYPDGPSLMWPYFTFNPNGYSAFSISQYESRASPGLSGGMCFSAVSGGNSGSGGSSGGITAGSPSTDFRFDAGTQKQITIAEGDTLVQRFAVSGDQSNVNYTAQGLPPGAAFDAFRGDFQYTPGFDVASRSAPSKRFNVTLFATSNSQVAKLALTIIVLNRNRVPDIVFSPQGNVRSEVGQPIAVDIQGIESDSDDRAKFILPRQYAVTEIAGVVLQKISTDHLFLSGSPQDGSEGVHVLTFTVVDRSGASLSRQLRIEVAAKNLPPQISAPESTSIKDGQVGRIHVSGFDPEGKELTWDVLGLSAGARVKYSKDGLEIDSAARRAGEVQKLQVFASDGVKTTSADVILSFETATTKKFTWPGSVSSHAVPETSLMTFDSHKHLWTTFSCDGEKKQDFQFAGRIGDLPLSIREQGKQKPAVFRIEKGQGYWILPGSKNVRQIAWGLAGDIPVPGDYDGDGTFDRAVFRPLTNEWLISFRSQPGAVIRDVPGPASSPLRTFFAADVDGDGKDDRVVISRKDDNSVAAEVNFATGKKETFALGLLKSSQGFVPFVGDFDGDGRSEFGVAEGGGRVRWLSSRTGEAESIIIAQSKSRGEFAVTRCNGGTKDRLVFFDGPSKQFSVLSGNALQSKTSVGVTQNSRSLFRLFVGYQYRALKTVPGDFDGDGVTNAAVSRAGNSPADSRWWVRSAQGEAITLPPIVSTTDDVVEADLDGSGRVKLGYFSSGTWLLQGSDGVIERHYWGLPGDKPVQADYDGDGRTDLAIYRPTDGTWWILYSNPRRPRAEVYQFGLHDDVPVPGDYDGDGVDEIAVWRPSLGQWFIRYGNGQVETRTLGGVGDTPIPGDFLGEGRVQTAVWRESSGTWLIRSADGTMTQKQWGLPNDKPVVVDFGGDHRLDLAVWRPSDGTWYSRELFSGKKDEIQVLQFGLSGDIPRGERK